MTKTQETLINRARANGGQFNLMTSARLAPNPTQALSAMLAACKGIPAGVAYVQSNVLVLIEK